MKRLLIVILAAAAASALECGENEEVVCSPCPPGAICATFICREMCVCIRGYVRDIFGDCVPRQLPQQCSRKNEVFNRCPEPCKPYVRTECNELLMDLFYPCDPTPTSTCRPRCDCDPGLLRNDEGNCVEKEGCCTDPRTVLAESPSPCAKTCANLDTFGNHSCVIRFYSPYACVCQEGYVQTLGGPVRCVRPENCPKQCGPNEVYDACPPCPPGARCPKICRPECVCKETYTRNSKGQCVPVVNDCDPNTEVFGIGNCDPTCEEPNRVCFTRKRLGCYCRKWHFRNEDNVCVRAENCPIVCNATLNEEFNRGGIDATCNNPDLQDLKRSAGYGCFCPFGYLRNHLNVCVLPENCNKCNGPYEDYRNGEGDASCDSPFVRSKPTDEFACYCKPGFVRNENGECIKPRDCPNDCATRPNEEFKLGACEPTCSGPNPDPSTCKKGVSYGCYCVEGFLRNSKWECVLPKDCKKPCPLPTPKPKPVCKKDEISICPKYCTKEATCDTEFKGGRPVCIPEGAFGYKCGWTCWCKPGLVRKDGKCVKPIKCCSDPNEVVAACPQPCEKTCSALVPKPGCMKEKCYLNTCICANGYVRDDDGVCVTIRECDDQGAECPGENEIFKACGTCDPSCDNPNPICTQSCVSGCFCMKGYVRNEDWECVPQEDCYEPYSYDHDSYYLKKWMVRKFTTVKQFLRWLSGRTDIHIHHH